ncbi:MAG: hypothetical protein R3D55_07020 [Chloroflexota bacterium]
MKRFRWDGVVVDGRSAVDESMLAGSCRGKQAGDELIGATLNKQGLLKFEATKVGKETALAQIIKLVEQAQGSKAPIQRVVDQVAAYFVPFVIAVAVLTFIIWLLVGGDFVPALIRLAAILVLACLIAMGLATPTSIMVGMGKGREGHSVQKQHRPGAGAKAQRHRAGQDGYDYAREPTTDVVVSQELETGVEINNQAQSQSLILNLSFCSWLPAPSAVRSIRWGRRLCGRRRRRGWWTSQPTFWDCWA